MTERKRHGRKLLIASIGVAAVSYVACGSDDTSPQGGGPGSSIAGSPTATGGGGNENTGGTADTGGGGTGGSSNVAGQIAVGNLMPIPFDAGIKDVAVETPVDGPNIIVANLIAPPPPDAKDDTK